MYFEKVYVRSKEIPMPCIDRAKEEILRGENPAKVPTMSLEKIVTKHTIQIGVRSSEVMLKFSTHVNDKTVK